MNENFHFCCKQEVIFLWTYDIIFTLALASVCAVILDFWSLYGMFRCVSVIYLRPGLFVPSTSQGTRVTVAIRGHLGRLGQKDRRDLGALRVLEEPKAKPVPREMPVRFSTPLSP